MIVKRKRLPHTAHIQHPTKAVLAQSNGAKN